MLEAITWPQVGILITLLTLAFAMYRWVTSIKDSMEMRFERERDQRVALERTFSAYQLIAAQTFVPAGMLKSTEDRLVGAIEKLETQMETLGDRFERYAEIRK